MTLSKSNKFLLAVAVQILIIFSVVIFKLSVLAGGTSVLLRIEPVDPRDPLRGDYLRFAYSGISTVPGSYFVYSSVRVGDTVYVPLQKGYRKYWEAGYGASKTLPQKTYGTVFLKGRVAVSVPALFDLNSSPPPIAESSGSEDLPSLTPRSESQQRPPSNENYRIVYGIEDYFIPEGAGRQENFWQKEASAQVAVDEEGRAVLKQVFLDNRPWPER